MTQHWQSVRWSVELVLIGQAGKKHSMYKTCFHGMHIYKTYDQWDWIIIVGNLCLWSLCNKCNTTIASLRIYLYVTFVPFATHTMWNWASILRQMSDCPLCISLSTYFSSVLSNVCFYHTHKVILFISALIFITHLSSCSWNPAPFHIKTLLCHHGPG